MKTTVYNNEHSHLVGVLSQLDWDETQWAINYLVGRLSIIVPTNAHDVGKNRLRLESELRKIESDESMKTYGMDTMSKRTKESAMKMVGYCTDDNMLRDASFAPRLNGTLLLCWNGRNIVASVNISGDDFSFAIFSPLANYEECGEGKITDTENVTSFYGKLRKAYEKL